MVNTNLMYFIPVTLILLYQVQKRAFFLSLQVHSRNINEVKLVKAYKQYKHRKKETKQKTKNKTKQNKKIVDVFHATYDLTLSSAKRVFFLPLKVH